jgi:hypothetical protein
MHDLRQIAGDAHLDRPAYGSCLVSKGSRTSWMRGQTSVYECVPTLKKMCLTAEAMLTRPKPSFFSYQKDTDELFVYSTSITKD